MIIGIPSALVTGCLLGAATGVFAGVGSLFFTVGAVVGCAAGMWRYYHQSLAQALVGLEEFAGPVFLHLRGSFPTYRWREGMFKGARESWLERSMLVTAWQSAGPAVEVRCGRSVEGGSADED